MKTLKELVKVKVLSKKEQKAITGGRACDAVHPCPPGSCCIKGVCTMLCP